MSTISTPPLIDPFGRAIEYLRLSVTDRCDFRCYYCMAEKMQFLPRKELLTLEELERLSLAFINLGVRKIRITGGEPLVRRDILQLFRALGTHLRPGALDEITLTSNGSQLHRFADQLAEYGVKRVNISLDTLDAEKFARITRNGRIEQTMEGIEAALSANMRVKINMVALKGVNEDEFLPMLKWCGERDMDLTFIEIMPMGDLGHVDRASQYMPLTEVRSLLAKKLTLLDSEYRTSGPARYVTIGESGQRVGFITPLTHNFCENCNRVRITCSGEMFMCLGQEDRADLRQPLREHKDDAALLAAIREAIARKPQGHDFSYRRLGGEESAEIAGKQQRHMSVTGG